MKYKKLVELYEYLEKTPAKLEKSDKISEFFKASEDDDLKMVVLLIQGRVYPSYSDKETGIASKMIMKVISTSLGFSESEIVKEYNKTGDLGLTAEKLMEKKKQKTLFSKPLTMDHVFENLQKLGFQEGSGSQDRKIRLIGELIAHSDPKEAKYIVRTALQDLRVGVAEGIIRDSIAKAFLNCEDMEKKKESVKAVEWAWFMRSDYSEIALIAKKGIGELRKVKPIPGIPIQPLLGEKSPSLEEALNAYEKVAVEFKYDGMRTQLHKKGEKIWLFTRRLENVTDAFPDIVKLAKESIKSDCIIDGETLGIDPKTGDPFPFQELSKRIHRKYDIHDISKRIPTETYLFDVMMVNEEILFDTPFEKRRNLLKKIIREKKGFSLAKQIITKDLKEADRFYKKALDSKQEGVFVKNLEAKYHPGRRVAGGWLKVKPIMETLDLVITGGVWGTGKRAGWIGSFILSCKEGDEYKECGMLGTGIKEKKTEDSDMTFKDLTKMLKPLMVKETGNKLAFRPKIIVEVAYEEIQKSPNYDSGYALRFPRLVRLRDDKKDSETLERLRSLYSIQKGKK